MIAHRKTFILVLTAIFLISCSLLAPAANTTEATQTGDSLETTHVSEASQPEKASSRTPVPDDIKEKIAEADKDYEKGMQALEENDFQTAAFYLLVAQGDYHECGEPVGESYALHGLGMVYHRVEKYEEAREYYDRALQIFLENKDLEGVGSALLNLGKVHEGMQQYDEALDYYDGAQDVFIEIENEEYLQTALLRTGVIYQATQQYDLAIEYYNQALDVSRNIGDLQNEGYLYMNIGVIYEDQGEIESALEYYNLGLETAREIGDVVFEKQAENRIDALTEK